MSLPVPTRSKERFRKWVIFLVLLCVAALSWLVANRGTDRDAEPAIAELNPEVFATLLRMVRKEHKGIMFPEANLEQFPYSTTAYAKYAAGLAEDTPCASWENGGISWWDPSEISWERSAVSAIEHPELWTSWHAILSFPRFRFCGFPAPYPEKPLAATPGP